MKKIIVQKSGWNWRAFAAGPFWYFHKRMFAWGAFLTSVTVLSLGILLIPVWVYCGLRGNRDFYQHLKKRNVYIRN